jgi:hypothetical protein
MESIARSYLDKGDVVAAAKLLTSLELSQPRVASLAKRCRVLADPATVPVPHRYTDMADAILDTTLPLEAYFGTMGTEEETLQRFNKLLLLVHPDKNPCKRASEAFVRLRTLKDTALQHVSDKKTAQAQSAAESAQYEKLRSTPPPLQSSLSSSSRRRDPIQARKSSLRTSSSGQLPAKSLGFSFRPQAVQLPEIVKEEHKDSFFSTRSLGGGGSGTSSHNTSNGTLRSRFPPMQEIVLTSLAKPTPSTTNGPPTNGMLDSMRSELLSRKEISLKLSCTFDGMGAATEGSLDDDTQVSGDPASLPTTDSGVAHCNEDGGSSDEETLFCTVRSTLSLADTTGSQSPLRATRVISTNASSFKINPSHHQEDIDGLVTDKVVAESFSTKFTSNALASLQAAWSGYRRRKAEKDASDGDS